MFRLYYCQRIFRHCPATGFVQSKVELAKENGAGRKIVARYRGDF
jgi:hypothetical protein